MKRTELAYIAGLVDADGCINLRSAHFGKGQNLVVSIGNTNEWLVRWLQFYLGGHKSKGRRAKATHKPLWNWSVSNQKAEDVLKLLLPYLKIKRPQAELGLQMRRDVLPQGPHLSQEAKAIREAQTVLMHSYNRKGIRF